MRAVGVGEDKRIDRLRAVVKLVDERLAEVILEGTSLAEWINSTGITHVQLWIEPNTIAGIEAFAPVLDLLDNS